MIIVMMMHVLSRQEASFPSILRASRVATTLLITSYLFVLNLKALIADLRRQGSASMSITIDDVHDMLRVFKLTANPFNSFIAKAADSGESYDTKPNPRLRPVSFSTIILTLNKFPYKQNNLYISRLVK
jgi:hypothetical protein